MDISNGGSFSYAVIKFYSFHWPRLRIELIFLDANNRIDGYHKAIANKLMKFSEFNLPYACYAIKFRVNRDGSAKAPEFRRH